MLARSWPSGPGSVEPLDERARVQDDGCRRAASAIAGGPGAVERLRLVGPALVAEPGRGPELGEDDEVVARAARRRCPRPGRPGRRRARRRRSRAGPPRCACPSSSRTTRPSAEVVAASDHFRTHRETRGGAAGSEVVGAPRGGGGGARCRPCSSASPSRSAWRSRRRVSWRRGGTTGRPRRPPGRASAPRRTPTRSRPPGAGRPAASGPHGRLICPKKSGASSCSEPVSATPKNAWNEIVDEEDDEQHQRRPARRPRVDADEHPGEQVPGEEEVGEHQQVARVGRQRQLEQPGPVEDREAEEEQRRGDDRVGEHLHRPRVDDLEQQLARPPRAVRARPQRPQRERQRRRRARAAAARSSPRPCASPCAR